MQPIRQIQIPNLINKDITIIDNENLVIIKCDIKMNKKYK